MNLSPHFTLEEMLLSQTAARRGIPNEPSEFAIENLKALCEAVLEPIRAAADSPIHISSGFRSIALNRTIGGVSSSQHCEGRAADITIKGLGIDEGIRLIKSLNLPVDQCINEGNAWIHVSHRHNGNNRNQFLQAVFTRHGTVYSSWEGKN